MAIMNLICKGLILLLSMAVSLEAFCYEDPNCDCYSEDWTGTCHSGLRQSPIDIMCHKSIPSLVKLQFNEEYYKTQKAFFIQNNGHTIQIQLRPTMDSNAKMSGYEMDGHQYIFAQMHFHWGKKNGRGSEHTVNGISYSMEVHLVHYSDKYANFAHAASATNDPKALGVVAVFLEVDPKHNVKHLGLEQIIQAMSREPQGYPHLVRAPLVLKDFLPFGNGQRFMRYLGSMTTPPCSEIVLWTIFEKPLYIRSEEVQAFRNIYERSGQHLNATLRAPQHLGNRVLEELTELDWHVEFLV